MSFRIVSTGSFVPPKVVTNEELTTFLDTSDEWITERTGVKERRVATTQTAATMVVEAGRRALEAAGMTPDQLDMILCATISGEFHTPSLACCVAEKIGTECPALDINAACTGFVYALDIASAYIETKRAKNILIICAEMMSSQLDWNDRNTCVLFGDGAAAAVVTAGNALKYMSLSAIPDTKILYLPSDTGNSPFIKNKIERSYLHMQGQEVFKFAVKIVGKDVKQALEAVNMSPDDIDYFILHQANKRIIDSIRVKLRQQEEKFPTNIDKYGNLSSVSVPLLLSEMQDEGKIKPGSTLFISAFGAGLTDGRCIMIWE